MEVGKIAIICAGPMGHAIAQAGLMAGYLVSLYDVDQGYAGKGATPFLDSLSRFTDNGMITGEQSREMLSRLIPAPDLKSALTDADLVIEAIFEDLALKKKLFAFFDKYAPPHCILTTSASIMSITAIAAATLRAEKVVGMHFFGLTALKKLVEVVYGERSSDDAVATVFAVSEKMGKTPVVVRKDSPGFIYNRVNAPAWLLLQLILEAGWPEPQDFDAAFRPFMPVTPFELVDQVGVDILLQTQEYYARTLSPDYRPRPALKELVAFGKLGMKTGKGIFNWSSGRPMMDTSHPTSEYDMSHIIALKVNEATKLLEEQVVSDPSLIDAAVANGGEGIGPFALARGIGYQTLVRRCNELANRFGIEAFRPTETMKGWHIDIDA